MVPPARRRHSPLRSSVGLRPEELARCALHAATAVHTCACVIVRAARGRHTGGTMHASPHAAYPHQPNHPGTLVAAWNSLFDDVGAGDLQGFDPALGDLEARLLRPRPDGPCSGSSAACCAGVSLGWTRGPHHPEHSGELGGREPSAWPISMVVPTCAWPVGSG